MSHTIRYSDDRATNEGKALRDCKFYLGDRFDKVVRTVREGVAGQSRTAQYRAINFYLDFAGIRGYWPVRAMVREIMTPPKAKKTKRVLTMYDGFGSFQVELKAQ